MKPTLTAKRWITTLTGLLFTLIVVSGLASLWGSETLSWRQLFIDGSLEQEIFFLTRLPRIGLALIAGIGLSAAGASFQGLLRNPLADPFILGVSSGAALGSILALALGMAFPWISVVAFLSALASTFIVYGLATYRRPLDPETLLLTGVIFNAFAFAFILVIHSLVTVEQAHKMLFFLIGSLEAVPYRDLIVAGSLVLLGFLILSAEGRPLNLLAESPAMAQTLGLNPQRHQMLVFFGASLVVGAVVSLTGLIGFVGLFVPHATRLLWGPDHRLLVPASALLGGILLVLCDGFSRTIGFYAGFSSELPVGAITALIGAPCFIVLLRKLR